MKEIIKKVILAFIVLVIFALIIGLSVSNIEEGTKIQEFYVSETYSIINKEKYYKLTNEEIQAYAEEPELILYCKEHVGEIVKIKIRYVYDKANKSYKELEFLSIEEE